MKEKRVKVPQEEWDKMKHQVLGLLQTVWAIEKRVAQLERAFRPLDGRLRQGGDKTKVKPWS